MSNPLAAGWAQNECGHFEKRLRSFSKTTAVVFQNHCSRFFLRRGLLHFSRPPFRPCAGKFPACAVKFAAKKMPFPHAVRAKKDMVGLNPETPQFDAEYASV